MVVLDEYAKYHGKEPFKVIVPKGILPNGIIFERAFYVGLKITMKDNNVLAIYVSEVATRRHTDLDIKDQKEANEIKSFIDKIIKKYSPEEYREF